MVGKYERMLAEGSVTTINQEVYGTACHAEETMRDEETLTETIVKYAEWVSQADSRVSELEVRLAILEMGSTAAQAPPGYAPQPPPYTAYFAPEAPTFQTNQPPQTIAFQPPTHKTQWIPAQQQQWIPQRPRKSGGSCASNADKRRKKKGHNYNPSGQQWKHHGGHTKPPNRRWQTPGQQVQHPGQHRNMKPFGNKIKEHHNLMYCLLVDTTWITWGSNANARRQGTPPNVTRNQAHTVWRACMKGQHKTLPDGTGAGMGWILANNLQKANYVIDKNQQTYKIWKVQQRT